MATSGLNYLSDALGSWMSGKDASRGMARGVVSPYARQSDLNGLCNVPDPFAGSIGYPVVRGYQYGDSQATKTKGFSLADFGKELLSGFVMGGLSSAAFYGAGKAVEAVKGSIRRSGEGVGKTLLDKTPDEISNMTRKQLEESVPDGWDFQNHNGRIHIKDVNGNYRIRIDPPDNKTNYTHIHILDENKNPLDINGNIVSPKDPSGHIPYND